MPRDLDAERRSSFFTWFNLAPVGAPVAVREAGAWHCFRPTGPAFHALVEVDALTDPRGHIIQACLGLDRAFIDDPRNAAFARDIAKSFLSWAVPKPSAAVDALIGNVADIRASGQQVIFRAPGPPPPPPDATGAYAAFLGKVERVSLPGDGLVFTNIAGAFPAAPVFEAPHAAASPQAGGRWLRIDVRPGLKPEASALGRLRRWVGAWFA